MSVLEYLGQPENTVTILMTTAGLQEEKSKMKKVSQSNEFSLKRCQK